VLAVAIVFIAQKIVDSREELAAIHNYVSNSTLLNQGFPSPPNWQHTPGLGNVEFLSDWSVRGTYHFIEKEAPNLNAKRKHILVKWTRSLGDASRIEISVFDVSGASEHKLLETAEISVAEKE
jgi:hypothetical protein